MNTSSGYEKDDYEMASVTLERGYCFGSCPDYKLVVEGNGKVFYHGKGYVKVIGVRKSLIPSEVAQSLIETLVNHNFQNFHDNYDYEDCIITDLATTRTTLQMRTVMKVVCRYGEPPSTPESV